MSPELEADLKSLKSFGDEIRLKLHLGAMEARDEWKKLEPELENALASAQTAAQEAVTELKSRAQNLLSGLTSR